MSSYRGINIETRYKSSQSLLKFALALYKANFGKEYRAGKSETSALELRMCLDLLMR